MAVQIRLTFWEENESDEPEYDHINVSKHLLSAKHGLNYLLEQVEQTLFVIHERPFVKPLSVTYNLSVPVFGSGLEPKAGVDPLISSAISSFLTVRALVECLQIETKVRIALGFPFKPYFDTSGKLFTIRGLPRASVEAATANARKRHDFLQFIAFKIGFMLMKNPYHYNMQNPHSIIPEEPRKGYLSVDSDILAYDGGSEIGWFKDWFNRFLTDLWSRRKVWLFQLVLEQFKEWLLREMVPEVADCSVKTKMEGKQEEWERKRKTGEELFGLVDFIWKLRAPSAESALVRHRLAAVGISQPW